MPAGEYGIGINLYRSRSWRARPRTWVVNPSPGSISSRARSAGPPRRRPGRDRDPRPRGHVRGRSAVRELRRPGAWSIRIDDATGLPVGGTATPVEDRFAKDCRGAADRARVRPVAAERPVRVDVGRDVNATTRSSRSPGSRARRRPHSVRPDDDDQLDLDLDASSTSLSSTSTSARRRPARPRRREYVPPRPAVPRRRGPRDEHSVDLAADDDEHVVHTSTSTSTSHVDVDLDFVVHVVHVDLASLDDHRTAATSSTTSTAGRPRRLRQRHVVLDLDATTSSSSRRAPRRPPRARSPRRRAHRRRRCRSSRSDVVAHDARSHGSAAVTDAPAAQLQGEHDESLANAIVSRRAARRVTAAFGAVLSVVNAGGSGERIDVALPAAGGRPTVRHDHRLPVDGAVRPSYPHHHPGEPPSYPRRGAVDYTLDEVEQGAIAVVRLGTARRGVRRARQDVRQPAVQRVVRSRRPLRRHAEHAAARRLSRALTARCARDG